MGNFSINTIKKIFDKVAEQSVLHPDYNWLNEQKIWQNKNNAPDVQISVAACDMDYDLWKYSRGPSKIGLHPLTLEQIWSFWSFYNKEKIDEEGRNKFFQTLTPYEKAMTKYKRAIIISAMLPFDEEILRQYAEKSSNSEISPMEMFCSYYGQINKLFGTILSRTALSLYNDGNPVIPLNGANLDKITDMTMPKVNLGQSNGFCKSHFSHKTISALTGLTQLGVSRLAMRHTADDGGQRFIGPVLTIIAFDETPVDSSETGTVILSDEWLNLCNDIADHTIQNDDVNSIRFCRYGAGKCGFCIKSCPSKALENSSPDREGNYSETIMKQSHRFADGTLQFDAGRCSDYKGTLGGIYNDWMCGRCYVTCGSRGVVDPEAVMNFESALNKFRA